ncbi:MAG: 4-hydroxyphenylpyruvate dioxygenase [Candidatus Midichloriaceae bacterium]|jgi:4-hydroxyphenylpyruvate dioxygenase
MNEINNLVGLDEGIKYEKSKIKPKFGSYRGFHHVEMIVGNAYQAAMYYSTCFGMNIIAYKGLETQSNEYSSYVLQTGKVIFVLTSPLNINEKKYNAFLSRHGDFIRDVAFSVDNSKLLYEHAITNGAKSILAPTEIVDEFGKVIISTVTAFGNVVHSFIEKKGYVGKFLPGYSYNKIITNTLSSKLPDTRMGYIDHAVANEQKNNLKNTVDYYIKTLGFHRFWSIDDKLLQTDSSGLRSVVVTDYDETIKIPVNEPAEGLKGTSQVQEFVDFHGTGGVQHIAICCDNLEVTVRAFKDRGGHILPIPPDYYDNLDKIISKKNLDFTVSIEVMKELDMVVDFDQNGYILQVFTRPLSNRPTAFIELIQRNNHNGFGAGNFKSLFSAIEAQQKLRHTLYQ